jgi:hypothetical protein
MNIFSGKTSKFDGFEMNGTIEASTFDGFLKIFSYVQVLPNSAFKIGSLVAS